MDNIANAIVIVGIGFLAVCDESLQLHNPYIGVGFFLAFVLALFTWVELDSDTTDKQKKLKTRKMELENRKLEAEIRNMRKDNHA